jgi:uncharacterized protein
MDADRIKIVKDLKKRLSSQLTDNLKEVILFGSQLTDDNSQNSDYDILIIIKQKTDWKLARKISDVCFEIDLKYGILTDAHILTENEINSPRGRQPIFYNAINQGYRV